MYGEDVSKMLNRIDAEHQRKRILCGAAVMAHTNMGQPAPTRERVQELLVRDTPLFPWNLNNYVEAISSHLFENDEIQKIFLEEAENWLEICKREPFLGSWLDKAALFS